MARAIQRGVASASAAAIVLAGLAVTASPAQAATCKGMTDLLSKRPVSAYGLPGGASAKIWDTGNRKNDRKELRVAAVRIPAGSLTPDVVTAPTLAEAVMPKTMVARDGRAVVVINGGHFNPKVPGIPVKSEVVHGVVRKGHKAVDGHLAVFADTKAAAIVKATLTGAVSSGRGEIPVGAVNWQGLSSSGVTVYTHAWGKRAHPAGPRTVVLADGKVARVLRGETGKRRPGPGQTFLTARAGRIGTALARLQVGDRVTVSATPGVRRFFDKTKTPLARPSGMLGVGGTLLVQGHNRASCGKRDELLRPRSIVGWTASGDMLVVAVSSRSGGGSTVHQAAEYLRRLGAVTAVNLDGGTSTTLLVRRSVGGKLIRLDQPGRKAQRPVVDALAFRA